MKSLLVAALLAEAGCWSVSPRSTVIPAQEDESDSAHQTPPPQARASEPSCTETGDRLALQICNDGETLAWTVTNRATVDLWAFVAPQGTKRGTFDRANVNVRAAAGHVVLSKVPLTPVGGERSFVAAVRLAPGASDTGAIPLGDRIDPAAVYITGAKVAGTSVIETVTLEVAFAEVRKNDRTVPTQPSPLTVVLSLHARQETIRALPIPW